MTTPCKALEAAVVGKRLEHGAHPILRWMASNVAAQRDAADNIKPDKEASAEKIDGISATLDGMARALVHQPEGSIEGWLKQSDQRLRPDAFRRAAPRCKNFARPDLQALCCSPTRLLVMFARHSRRTTRGSG
jgi:hypothetical protein